MLTVNVIDESNQEVFDIEIDLGLSDARMLRVMEWLEEMIGLPRAIHLDIGGELRSSFFIGLV